MSARSLAIVDTWLLALANVSIYYALLLIEVSRFTGSGLWNLGYLSGSIICYALWLALGTAKWWHRAGQALLVTAGPLLPAIAQHQGAPSWLILLGAGSSAYLLLRLARLRIAQDANVVGGWQWSLQDLLAMTALVGVVFKVWQAEAALGSATSWQRWRAIWDEIGAYGILATHGGLLILPTLWLFLRAQPLTIMRGLIASSLTVLIAALDCWLIAPLLNEEWSVVSWGELWKFWLSYVWQPQLALVSVALVNALAWRWLGWRIVRAERRARDSQPAT